MYQLALKPHHIRALFRMKETFRKPMTKVIEEILNWLRQKRQAERRERSSSSRVRTSLP